jgi:hypothetical protein
MKDIDEIEWWFKELERAKALGDHEGMELAEGQMWRIKEERARANVGVKG